MSNAIRLSLGIAVTALLIGCNKAEQTGTEVANDTNVAAANLTGPTATPVATPAAAKSDLSTDFMIGKWSAMGSCDDTIEFRKDGSIATPMGPGRWSLTGDQMLIEVDGAGKQVPSTVVKVDDKTIEVARAGAGPEKQIRC